MNTDSKGLSNKHRQKLQSRWMWFTKQSIKKKSNMIIVTIDNIIKLRYKYFFFRTNLHFWRARCGFRSQSCLASRCTTTATTLSGRTSSGYSCTLSKVFFNSKLCLCHCNEKILIYSRKSIRRFWSEAPKRTLFPIFNDTQMPFSTQNLDITITITPDPDLCNL